MPTSQADNRQPDYDLAPERRVLPQRGWIYPVSHGPEPVPESFTRRRRLDDLPINARYIQLRAGCVIGGKQVQRPVSIEVSRHRPLIDAGQEPRFAVKTRCGQERVGLQHCCCLVDARKPPAAGKIYEEADVAAETGAKYRLTGEHFYRNL
jgi:hypothetical protein